MSKEWEIDDMENWSLEELEEYIKLCEAEIKKSSRIKKVYLKDSLEKAKKIYARKCFPYTKESWEGIAKEGA